MFKSRVTFTASVLCVMVVASPALAASKKKTTKAKPKSPTTASTASAATASAPAGQSFLDGKLIAPGGVSVVLQKDGADDVTISSSTASAGFSTTDFKFPKPYPNGTPYTLSIKSASPGFTCVVDKGIRGTISLSPGFIRIGCDATFDLVSRSTDNTKFGTAYDSSAPVIAGGINGDGRFVAFVSSAAGLGGSSGKKRQIIWRDRASGETRLVSASGPNGAEGDGDSFAPSISADGSIVVFESYAKNIVPGDTNGVRDIYAWTPGAPAPVRVSVGMNGEPNSESTDPSVSADGRFVAFSSGASNLTPGVQGINTINVYRRDLLGETTTLISKDANGQGVGGSNPSISDDGNRVAFYSYSAALVAGDNNGLWDDFVYDVPTAAIKRVTLTSGGGERNQGTESISRVVAPSISGNGAFVAYATTATNVVPGDTNGTQDVFVVNIDSGAVKRVSVGAAGVEANGDSPVGQGEEIGISFDGSWVAFSTNAANLGGSIVLKNIVSDEVRVLSQASGAGRPMVSRYGGYVVFSAGTQLDNRYSSSGLFARYTGNTRCQACVN